MGRFSLDQTTFSRLKRTRETMNERNTGTLKGNQLSGDNYLLGVSDGKRG